MQNWPIYRKGTSATATTAGTVRVALRSTAEAAGASDVMIDNPGPLDVWVLAGDSTVTADATCLRVPAGSLQPYRVGDATHVALRTASGTQAVVVHVGDGQ